MDAYDFAHYGAGQLLAASALRSFPRAARLHAKVDERNPQISPKPLTKAGLSGTPQTDKRDPSKVSSSIAWSALADHP
tara:strand:- start:537 stop:770 length:234 start_codon:yes stop_codon:yes gene_type:complete